MAPNLQTWGSAGGGGGGGGGRGLKIQDPTPQESSIFHLQTERLKQFFNVKKKLIVPSDKKIVKTVKFVQFKSQNTGKTRSCDAWGHVARGIAKVNADHQRRRTHGSAKNPRTRFHRTPTFFWRYLSPE